MILQVRTPAPAAPAAYLPDGPTAFTRDASTGVAGVLDELLDERRSPQALPLAGRY
jgi:hypothetical protein